MLIEARDWGDFEMTAETDRLLRDATKTDEHDHRFRIDAVASVIGQSVSIRLFVTGKNWPEERNWQLGDLLMTVSDMRAILKMAEVSHGE